MGHYAFVAPPYLGHLNPVLALAAAVRRRGHRTTVFGMADVAPIVEGQGCAFVPLGRRTHPAGHLAAMTARMGRPGGVGLFRIMADMSAMTRMLCDELPAACRAQAVDGLVVDELEAAGGLVALHLGLPYVSVANALSIRREPTIPPPFVDWHYDPSPRGVWRNQGGYRVADLLMRPVSQTIATAAARLGVPDHRSLDACLSSAAGITQLVPALDFPRRGEPHVHACGPLRVDADDADLSGLLGDGRPLVFASLGTLQGGRGGIFRSIATACARLDLHLVIAHGGRLPAAIAAALPGRPVVRAFVPQQALLRHVSLAVTNGGLNTVLDAAAAAVPTLVIPIAFEQGAIGARVARAGVGAVLPRWRLNAIRLESAMQHLLNDPDIRLRTRAMAAAIAGAGGADRAASIVEAALARGSDGRGDRPKPDAYAVARAL